MKNKIVNLQNGTPLSWWERVLVLFGASVKPSETYVYGYDRTIHQTEQLDVETDEKGSVVAVWFRCMMLPFEQNTVDDSRAESMRTAYTSNALPKLLGVEVVNK